MSRRSRARRYRQRREEMRHVGPALVVVAAIIVGVLAVVVLTKPADNGRADPRETMSQDSSAALGEVTTLYEQHGAGSRMLLLGDSQAAGYGASKPSLGWAPRMARSLGWTLDNRAIGGTGFVSAGPRGENRGTFGDQLRRRIETGAEYDVVMVQGVQNDFQETDQEVADAVRDAIDTAREAWPDAAVVIIGPIAPVSLSNGLVDRSRLITDIAASMEALHVDPVAERWVTSANNDAVEFDPAHVNDLGYDIAAEKMVEYVRSVRV